MISETEMFNANGLGHVVEALRDYGFSMTRNIDNCLKFLALAAAVGMIGLTAVSLTVAAAASIGMFHIATFAGLVALGSGVLSTGCCIALFRARGTDFEGRYIRTKFGKAAFDRYTQYRKPIAMQKRLYEEVERFNKLVRALNVSDEIDAAGVQGAKIQDRETLLKSMAIARGDLIRALKIERVMRENADVSGIEFQAFNVDLTQIAAMQIQDAASQHGKLLNEAFQIAQTVQVEVRKLQEQDRARI